MELNRKTMIRIDLLILFGIVVFWLFENFDQAKAVFFWLFSLITPLLIGGCIAFILNVPMRAIERHLWPHAKQKSLKKLKRPCAIILTLFCFAAVLAILVVLIVPELIRTASSFTVKEGLVKKKRAAAAAKRPAAQTAAMRMLFFGRRFMLCLLCVSGRRQSRRIPQKNSDIRFCPDIAVVSVRRPHQPRPLFAFAKQCLREF